MKFILACFVVLCGLIIYLFPFVKKERACYDTAFEFVRRERVNTPSKGISLKEICRVRVEMIATLQECNGQIEQTNVLTQFFRSGLRFAASFDHPFSKNLQSFTYDHNTQCADYRQYQFQLQ